MARKLGYMFWSVFASIRNRRNETSKIGISSISRAFRRRLLAFLLGCVVAALTAASIKAITLSWNPNSEPDIAGYVIYRGTKSGAYNSSNYVGNVTQYAPPNLVNDVNYFFAATAVNTSGLESDFSNEILVKVPGTGAGGSTFAVTNKLAPEGMKLTWPGGTDSVYRVLFKSNLSDSVWQQLSQDITATNGIASWIDAAYQQTPVRLYRVVQTQ